MCLSYPGRVKNINGLKATVEYTSSSKQVLIGDKQVKVGDRVQVQMGVIVKVLSDQEFNSVISSWDEVFSSKT